LIKYEQLTLSGQQVINEHFMQSKNWLKMEKITQSSQLEWAVKAEGPETF